MKISCRSMWSIIRPAMWCHVIGFFLLFSLLKKWKPSIDFRQGIILTRESQSTYVHITFAITLILHACKMLAYHGQTKRPDSKQMKTCCTWMAQKLLGWVFHSIMFMEECFTLQTLINGMQRGFDALRHFYPFIDTCLSLQMKNNI